MVGSSNTKSVSSRVDAVRSAVGEDVEQDKLSALSCDPTSPAAFWLPNVSVSVVWCKFLFLLQEVDITHYGGRSTEVNVLSHV